MPVSTAGSLPTGTSSNDDSPWALTSISQQEFWGDVDLSEYGDGEVESIAVVWTAAAIGAALGDLLPGESGGSDITRTFEAEVGRLLGRDQ